MDLSTEVRWSAESYSLDDLRTGSRECPLLLKVERGLYGTTEDGTIPANQMVLLHKWEVSERVVAINREGLWLTIPIDHKHKLEVIDKKNSFEKLGPYTIKDVIRRFKPPVKARFDPKKSADFYIQNKLHNSKSFGFFELASVHYMDFGKGSVISTDGKINRHRISILPMNVGVEFFIGTGMYKYSGDYFSNLLQEISRSSGPLVNDNSNVYGFSGITECDDNTTMTISRPTAKTRAEGKTWGRRAGSILYSSASVDEEEPSIENPSPIRRHTMPNIEPLHPTKDEVDDQAMAIYANHDVATTRTKKQSGHSHGEQRRSESTEPIPIYENVEGLRRTQKEADGIRHTKKDKGVSNGKGNDLDKADDSSSQEVYENFETAGDHGSGNSSDDDYYNHPGARHSPGGHKWQEDAKHPEDSPEDIYENQATASLLRNKELSEVERQEKNGEYNCDLDSPDAIYENQVTASAIQKALSDRRRQQRQRDDHHNEAKEGDHHDSDDAIYQNQAESSSAKKESSAPKSINKKPAPNPRVRKDSLGSTQGGGQGDGDYYTTTMGGMNEDPSDSMYQNQNQLSVSLSDISGLPPPAHRVQGSNQYINASGGASRNGSVSSRTSTASLSRYRPSELFKGSIDVRQSNRELDGQSTISSMSSISSRSSDYTRYWHTDDAVDDASKQLMDASDTFKGKGVEHPAKLEVQKRASSAYGGTSSDNSDYEDMSAQEKSRRSRRTHSTVVDKGPLHLPAQDDLKSEGTDDDDYVNSLAEISGTTSSVRNASISSKSGEVSQPKPESIRKKDDSQPVLPPKDYTSKAKDSNSLARKSDISNSPAVSHPIPESIQKSDDSKPILPSKDYTSKAKDSIPPGRKADISSSPVVSHAGPESTRKSDESKPTLPSKDYTSISKAKGSVPQARKSDNISSSPVQSVNKAPALPARDPIPSKSASIGKNSPNMPREKAPRPPQPAASGSYKTQTFHSLKDIPVDISGLGVSEVADCLSLLNLEEFIEPFAAVEVDGQLLNKLTRGDLQEVFGMGSVSANKVVLLKNGAVQSQNKLGGSMLSGRT